METFAFDRVTPSRVLEHIIRRHRDPKEYIYLIMGRSGPTGKTWLAEKLKEHGYNAMDISENIYCCVSYPDDGNYYDVDDVKKIVTIVLNERLPVCRGGDENEGYMHTKR